MTASLCPLPHKHHGSPDRPCTRCYAENRSERDCPRRAGQGSVVCVGHLIGLAQHLEELPGLYADLLVGTKRGEQAKIARTDHSEITVGNPALASRTRIRALLASWVVLVAEEQRSTRLPPDTVRAMAEWLGHRVDSWVRGQGWAADMVREVAELHRNAVRIASPFRHPSFVVGPCLEAPEGGDPNSASETCTGEMRALLGYDPPRSITCTVCGHEVPPGLAHRLARAYGRRQLVTADDAILALATRGILVNATTLRQWAHRDKIVSYEGPDGRARYLLDTLKDDAP